MQQRATLADDELSHGVHALALKLQLAEERAESDELMCADALPRTHNPCRVRSHAPLMALTTEGDSARR